MWLPKLGESILDPACGTGGFLTSVVDSFTIDSTEDYTTLQKLFGALKKTFSLSSLYDQPDRAWH